MPPISESKHSNRYLQTGQKVIVLLSFQIFFIGKNELFIDFVQTQPFINRKLYAISTIMDSIGIVLVIFLSQSNTVTMMDLNDQDESSTSSSTTTFFLGFDLILVDPDDFFVFV